MTSHLEKGFMPILIPDVEVILFYLLRKHTGGKRTLGVAQWKLVLSAYTTIMELLANNDIVTEMDLAFSLLNEGVIVSIIRCLQLSCHGYSMVALSPYLCYYGYTPHLCYYGYTASMVALCLLALPNYAAITILVSTSLY